tara:strand:- start:1369 stop:1704 length:336 start_codon:yes stop_codon:yes gene_type:complete
MITKEILINGKNFRLTLTDTIISQVNNLKSLYNTAYEDPESFEQVSAEISSAIQVISTSVEPTATDSDLDVLIQEIIKTVDDKAAEIEKISGNNTTDKTNKKKYKTRKPKK